MCISLKLILLIAIILVECHGSAEKMKPTSERPNIVIIMADDLGFADTGIHGSEFPTPNIDALAMNGILLNRFYTQPMCTPSRSALLTGKYPIHTGMQHFVIDAPEPWGLGLSERTMYEIFRDAGYRTNLVGKWHLGFHRKDYLPTSRGVQKFFGYWGPFVDYWDHTYYRQGFDRGLDLRAQTSVTWDHNGTYATDMIADKSVQFIEEHDTQQPMFMVVSHLAPHTGNTDDPMQAPEDVIERFSYIEDPKRRIDAAMVSILDEAVGKTIQALDERGMLENTIILFCSDNGAPTLGLHSNLGSNWPFRGQKNSPWEGAMRVPAAIWSKDIHHNKVYDGLFHLTDVLPTLTEASNIDISSLPSNLDGVSQWGALTGETSPFRTNLLYNIDDIFGYFAIQENDYKLVNGSTLEGIYDGYLGDFVLETPRQPLSEQYEEIIQSVTHRVLSKHHDDPLTFNDFKAFIGKAEVHCQPKDPTLPDCNASVTPCLFKIDEDPCEINNLAETEKGKIIVDQLMKSIERYRQGMLPIRNKPKDPWSNPSLHNHTWTNWMDIRL